MMASHSLMLFLVLVVVFSNVAQEGQCFHGFHLQLPGDVGLLDRGLMVKVMNFKKGKGNSLFRVSCLFVMMFTTCPFP